MRSIAPWLCAAFLVALPLIAHAAPAPTSPDRAYVDAVLDALVEQGILTPDQVARIRERATGAANAAQAALPPATPAAPAKKKWTDTINLSGYMQGRWQFYPDRQSVKDAGGGTHLISNEFLVRRARFTLDVKPTDTTEVLFQPELWDSTTNSVTIREAYIDQFFGQDLASRVRLGQQKVPFGIDVPQSSATHLQLEPNWVTKRAVPSDYDVGLTYFYTTPADRRLFEAGKSRWGMAGDYGTFAFSVFNGQGTGQGTQEVNSQKHYVARLCKPFALGPRGQYAEIGAGFYGGEYFSKGAKANFAEHLWGAHAYIAPMSLGFQGEVFTGQTEGHGTNGFYATGLWQATPRALAFLRYDEMNGWIKGSDVPGDRHRVSVGCLYDLNPATRLTLEYDRDKLDTPGGGNSDLLGLQMLVRF